MSEESELNHFESLLEIQPHLVGAGSQLLSNINDDIGKPVLKFTLQKLVYLK